MRRVIALAVCAAVPASASAGKYPKPVNCGTGEPAGIARHLDDVSGLTATNVTVGTVACCQTGSDTYAGPVPD